MVRGNIVVFTEFYDAMVLSEGESLYIDSSMGHAYLAAEGCDEAEVLGVMSSSDAELLDSLLNIHEEQLGGVLDENNSRRARALPRL